MPDEGKNEHVENPDVRYELKDASLRQVIVAGVGLAVATVLSCFAMYLLFNLLKHGETQAHTINPMAGPRTLPPAPRLLDKPWQELDSINAKENAQLSTYGWVDKNAGTVRIPINQALDLIAQKGLPVRAPGAQAATAPMPGARQGQPQAVPRNSASPGAPIMKQQEGRQ